MNPTSLGATTNIRVGFPGPADEQQAVLCRLNMYNIIITLYALYLIISGLLLYIVWEYDVLSPNFQSWLFIGIFLSWAAIILSESYHHIQAHIQARRAAINSLLGTELHLQLSSSQGFATRGRLQGLIQLIMLEREFNGLDHATSRASRSDNAHAVAVMSQDDIIAVVLHNYNVTDPENQGSGSQEGASTSTRSRDDMICDICLEQAEEGELVRSSICIHQFHGKCFDEYFGREGVCPVCKLTLGSTTDDEEMV